VLAQRPDLRWRATPLPDLQLALLRSAAERVRVGGTIVYSVCTLNPDECEAVVDASGLRVLPLRRSGRRSRTRRGRSSSSRCQHVHGTSGFFVARLARD
jgi:16S rRNA (cytosine967-C5)-methyltransferase